MTREENDRNWDEYFIEGTNVLKNNLGITNKEELKTLTNNLYNELKNEESI